MYINESPETTKAKFCFKQLLISSSFSSFISSSYVPTFNKSKDSSISLEITAF